MKCKNCQVNEAIKYSKYSTGEFCSMKCARSYSTMLKRDEISKKVSEKLKGRKCSQSSFKKGNTYGSGKSRVGVMLKRYHEYMLVTPFEILGKKLQRKKILFEQNNKCAICNNEPVWNGKPLVFHKDHINGNHKDDRRENLRMVCPNCHYQLPTSTSKRAIGIKRDNMLNALRRGGKNSINWIKKFKTIK